VASGSKTGIAENETRARLIFLSAANPDVVRRQLLALGLASADFYHRTRVGRVSQAGNADAKTGF
jgi:hypothetical protein